jgi:hypothetical protein
MKEYKQTEVTYMKIMQSRQKPKLDCLARMSDAKGSGSDARHVLSTDKAMQIDRSDEQPSRVDSPRVES